MAKKISWQQRQAELKKAAIIEIQNRPSGESPTSAARRISKAYSGKRLPEGKRMRLSLTSLARLWREWKKNPTDAVFDLNYDGGASPLIQPWISLLLTDYAIHNGLNIPQAYKRLKSAAPDLPFVSRTMRRHLSDADQKRIAMAVRLRKQQGDLDEKTKKLTGGKP